MHFIPSLVLQISTIFVEGGVVGGPHAFSSSDPFINHLFFEPFIYQSLYFKVLFSSLHRSILQHQNTAVRDLRAVSVSVLLTGSILPGILC